MAGLLKLMGPGDTRLLPPDYVFPPWQRPSPCIFVLVVVWITQLANVAVLGSEHTTLIIPSLSSACYTRCAAKCEDTEAGLSPPDWGMPEELISREPISYDLLSSNSDVCCFYYCSIYKDDEWKEYCNGDADCLTSCANLTTFETAHVNPPCEPKELRLKQEGPYDVTLSWDEAASETQHHVLYVIQRTVEDEQNDTREIWVNVNTTMSTWMTLYADPCEELHYRVFAYNQYGTKGASSEVNRTDLPRPGVIEDESATVQFLSNYFQYELTYSIPSEWSSDDITSMDFIEPFRPDCAFNFLPPTASHTTFEQSAINGEVWTFSVLFFETAYECTYYTQIAAVSRCGVKGHYTEIAVNLEDCTKIVNYPCPTEPYVQPGLVENVTAVVTPGSRNVTFLWTSPDYEGTEGVSHYVVQWGPTSLDLPLPVVEIDEEGSVQVPWYQKSLSVEIQSFNVQYGVKVVAVDEYSIKVVNNTLEIVPLYDVFVVPEPVEEPEDGNAWIINIVVPIVVAVVCAVGVGVVVYLVVRRRQRASKKSLNSDLRVKVEKCMVKNPLYEDIEKLGSVLDGWEIPSELLELGELLGRGAFGQVVGGKLQISGLLPEKALEQARHSAGSRRTESHEIDVAVKMLHDFAGETQRQDFLQEMRLMRRLGAHPNIVNMIGCCTRGEPVCLVVEHAPHGDLLHYLRNYRHRRQNNIEDVTSDIHLTLLDLLSFARQITMGMEYLSEKGFVHRDLAARNVMVGYRGILKIGDFGLTRYIYSDKLYVAGKGSKLPLKWMALESIEEYCFTTETDVWSFGVLLFELVTLGGTPYPTISNKELLRELKNGYRMEKPDNCSDTLYEMMLACWRTRPSERPSFCELHQQLDAAIVAMTSSQYLDLLLDETRDYYQVVDGDSSTSSCEDDCDGQVDVLPFPGAVSPHTKGRSVSESTRGGADSGVGVKSGATSEATLASTWNLSVGSTSGGGSSITDGDGDTWHAGDTEGPQRTSSGLTALGAFRSPESTRQDVIQLSTRDNGVTFPKSETSLQPTTTTETKKKHRGSSTSKVGASSTTDVNPLKRTRKAADRLSTSSVPILLQLQIPMVRRQGGMSRTSTSSMDQLLPAYSATSVSSGTNDSGSHSWFGDTNV